VTVSRTTKEAMEKNTRKGKIDDMFTGEFQFGFSMGFPD
jgi:hypothetical protein